MRTTETGLFPVLEAALRASSEPLDCQALFDMPEVKQHAETVMRVSDYLGNLWRKGLVTRLPAAGVSIGRSKWMYQWKGNKGPKYLDGALEYAPKIIADRPAMLITEEGNNIILEFQNLVITVRQKTTVSH